MLKKEGQILWGRAIITAFLSNAGSILRKGFLFGLGTWWVLWLFFEPWVPYNMFGEPFLRMALELALELVAMVATGITIAFLYRPSTEEHGFFFYPFHKKHSLTFTLRLKTNRCLFLQRQQFLYP